MESLLESLLQLVTAMWNVVASSVAFLFPLLPLFAWVAFWLFAVDWAKLRRVMLDSGWIAVALLALLAVMVWGSVSPPADGYHLIPGLMLTNYFGKLVYVTALVCIMFLCGAVQLGGCCAGWVPAQEAEAADEPAEHGHGQHGH
jgi:hypothetical protein